MTVYLDLAVLLNFLIDYALLLGTNRLAGYPPGWGRSAGAAAAGSLYAGLCLLPEFHFMGHTLWRIVSLGLMSGIAFGWNRGAVQRGILFVFLSMALGGVAVGIGSRNFGSLVLAAAGVTALCVFGFRSTPGSRTFVPAELTRQGRTIRLTALMDTGNTLKDPISGEQVLVAGADIGAKLGLSREQLLDPIGTMTENTVPGLRLIPYCAVGRPEGMLLAMRFDAVKLNGKEAGHLVAFAPEEIGGAESYQALAGGMI